MSSYSQTIHLLAPNQFDIVRARPLAQIGIHRQNAGMKESVLDVLMYLFENYRLGEFSDADYHSTLRTELDLAGESAWGRPVDIEVMPDGSLLVSDDYAGAIYRIAYRGPLRSRAARLYRPVSLVHR